MLAKIRRSKFGFQYQIENDRGYTFFPDGVVTPEQMKAYFRNGGHQGIRGTFNEPDLQFVSDSGQPSVHYSIKPSETFAGQKFAVVNNDQTKKFLFDNPTTDTEKLEYLRHFLPEDQEAEAFENDKDKINSYLQIADIELKTAYKQMMNDRLTNEVMTEQCKKNAAGYNNLQAEIEFIE